jgi:hypothetical protein
MSLKDTALIVNPTFKVWSGRKLDKDATRELCSDKNAVQGSARVNKSLMPDEPKLKRIRKIVGEARNYHYQHTLPWEDRGGGRILPAGLFVPYQKQMEAYRDKIKAEIAEFCDPQYFNEAKKEGMRKLGGLANEWEYPSVNKVKYLFEAEVHFYPIPAADDFRVNLSAHDLQRLKQKNREQEVKIIKKTTEHLWKKLSDLAEHAEERLGDPNKSFHASLNKNVQHFAEILPELNLGEDRFIEGVAKDLADAVGDDPKVLRTDEKARSSAAQGARSAIEKIQEQMEAFKDANTT